MNLKFRSAGITVIHNLNAQRLFFTGLDRRMRGGCMNFERVFKIMKHYSSFIVNGYINRNLTCVSNFELC